MAVERKVPAIIDNLKNKIIINATKINSKIAIKKAFLIS